MSIRPVRRLSPSLPMHRDAARPLREASEESERGGFVRPHEEA